MGKVWKGARRESLLKVRDVLLRRGGVADSELRNPSELWRIRIDRAVFTAYTSGTLYCNGGEIPELPFVYETISDLLGLP